MVEPASPARAGRRCEAARSTVYSGAPQADGAGPGAFDNHRVRTAMPRPTKAFHRQRVNAAAAWKRGEKKEAYKLWEAAASSLKEHAEKKRNKKKKAADAAAAEAAAAESTESA